MWNLPDLLSQFSTQNISPLQPCCNHTPYIFLFQIFNLVLSKHSLIFLRLSLSSLTYRKVCNLCLSIWRLFSLAFLLPTFLLLLLSFIKDREHNLYDFSFLNYFKLLLGCWMGKLFIHTLFEPGKNVTAFLLGKMFFKSQSHPSSFMMLYIPTFSTECLGAMKSPIIILIQSAHVFFLFYHLLCHVISKAHTYPEITIWGNWLACYVVYFLISVHFSYIKVCIC